MDRAERFQQLSRLFDEVVDLELDQREAAIAERCAGDAQLERELRDLLIADGTGDPGAFLAGVVASEAATIPAPDLHGQILGSWRILEAIGEGGMGTVYRADRADGEYEAQAAIKLVRGGVPSAHLAARFRSERQILAGLSHPGVAQLLDGGTTPDGTPYLVMEYIDGKPITDWCDEQDLDVDARLAVFLKVCDSVAYAHRALVAHRDLKPSNILVNGAGEPKLLDFGIAKLMEEMGEDGERVTQTYGIMTPAYASPEQVSGERAGVAADIYALGVLLYELLSDRLPIDTKGLTPVQLISRVTQQVPAVLSSVVDDPIRRRRLVGDLDAIVSRALRKEPEQRYASVEALAEDIRLHREGRPIRARNDDWRYRTGKLVRRNAGVVSGGALLVILGVTFAINAVLQARAVAVERDRAEVQRAAAERVSTFLEELFTEVDPNQASAQDITVRQLLDRGRDQVLTGLESEPEIQARLATVMGRVYRALAEYDAAEPLLDSALAIRRRLPAGDPAELAGALLERGALAYELGEYEEALEFHAEALEDFRAAADGEDDLLVASALDWLSVSEQELGRLDEAEQHSRESVTMLRRIDPEPNEDLASGLTTFTDILRGNGKLDEALAIGQEGLAMSRTVYGNDHLEVAAGLNQMASTLNQLGRAEEAIPLVEEGLTIRMAAFEGKPHVETGASLGNLANMLIAVGRVDEGVERRQQSIAMLRAVVGEDHPYIAASLNSLGGALAAAGRTEEAAESYRESVEAHRRAFPPGHSNIGYPLTGLGRIYLEQGRAAEAETVLREAYDARSGGLPERHWHIAASGLDLGRALDALGRLDEAERYLMEAYDILGETFGPDDGRTGQAREALRDHLERRGLTERAAALDVGPGG
jgi:serine/threonine-protein kinase